MITRAFQVALAKMKERDWNCIYVAVDWHDTICKSTYDDSMAFNFYPHAIDALQKLSDDSRFKLILFSSSYEEKSMHFLNLLNDFYGIEFDFINSNSDVKNTEYGDFSKKFYFDVMIDDKAGFEAKSDWISVLLTISN